MPATTGYDRDDWQMMVEEMLETSDAHFSSWEMKFLEDLNGRDAITDGQWEKLCEVYEQKMS